MERFGWKLVKCVYFLKCYYEIAICKLKARGVKKQMKMPSELVLFDSVNTFVLNEIWSDFCVCVSQDYTIDIQLSEFFIWY